MPGLENQFEANKSTAGWPFLGRPEVEHPGSNCLLLLAAGKDWFRLINTGFGFRQASPN